jgi:hypothetical protein
MDQDRQPRLDEHARTCVNRYLNLIEELSDTKIVMKHYPSFRYPESLLPCAKSALKQTLEKSIASTPYPGNELYVFRLERGLWYLNRFVPDAPANPEAGDQAKDGDSPSR